MPDVKDPQDWPVGFSVHTKLRDTVYRIEPEVEPDPAFLGTEKWREHKAPTEDMMSQVWIRTIEAWRDYLASGRVEGNAVVYLAPGLGEGRLEAPFADVIITITVSRR